MGMRHPGRHCGCIHVGTAYLVRPKAIALFSACPTATLEDWRFVRRLEHRLWNNSSCRNRWSRIQSISMSDSGSRCGASCGSTSGARPWPFRGAQLARLGSPWGALRHRQRLPVSRAARVFRLLSRIRPIGRSAWPSQQFTTPLRRRSDWSAMGPARTPPWSGASPTLSPRPCRAVYYPPKRRSAAAL